MNTDAPHRRKITINSLKNKIAKIEQKWKELLDICDEDSGTAEASISVTIYQTHWDGSLLHIPLSNTELYAAGSYKDTFRLDEDSVKFVPRELRLDTCNLQKSFHFPL